jgi:hypothetical protein
MTLLSFIIISGCGGDNNGVTSISSISTPTPDSSVSGGNVGYITVKIIWPQGGQEGKCLISSEDNEKDITASMPLEINRVVVSFYDKTDNTGVPLINGTHEFIWGIGKLEEKYTFGPLPAIEAIVKAEAFGEESTTVPLKIEQQTIQIKPGTKDNIVDLALGDYSIGLTPTAPDEGDTSCDAVINTNLSIVYTTPVGTPAPAPSPKPVGNRTIKFKVDTVTYTGSTPNVTVKPEDIVIEPSPLPLDVNGVGNVKVTAKIKPVEAVIKATLVGLDGQDTIISKTCDVNIEEPESYTLSLQSNWTWYQIRSDVVNNLKNKIPYDKLSTLNPLYYTVFLLKDLNDCLEELNFTQEEIKMVADQALHGDYTAVDEPIDITATLLKSNGQGASDKSIIFTITGPDGNSTINGITDNEGKCKISLNGSSTKGIINITAEAKKSLNDTFVLASKVKNVDIGEYYLYFSSLTSININMFRWGYADILPDGSYRYTLDARSLNDAPPYGLQMNCWTYIRTNTYGGVLLGRSDVRFEITQGLQKGPNYSILSEFVDETCRSDIHKNNGLGFTVYRLVLSIFPDTRQNFPTGQVIIKATWTTHSEKKVTKTITLNFTH